MNSVVKSIISFVLIGVLGFGVVIGNQVAGMFESELGNFLSPPMVDEESLAVSSVKGQEMASRIMEEGTIMLKNDGVLPLEYVAENKKVNVFGWRSIEWIYGSEGQNSSGGTLPEDGDFSKNIDLLKALKNYGISYNERLEDMYFDYMQPKYEGKDFRGEHINGLMPLREPSITDKNYYTDELLGILKKLIGIIILIVNAGLTKIDKIVDVLTLEICALVIRLNIVIIHLFKTVIVLNTVLLERLKKINVLREIIILGGNTTRSV